MPTEREKMLAGELYLPLDPELSAGRRRARELCRALNATVDQDAERRRIAGELFGRGGDTAWVEPPFFCDYGANIELGERVPRCRSTPRCTRWTPRSGGARSTASWSRSGATSGSGAAP